MENKVFNILKTIKPQLCVMATVNKDNQPQCAVLAYVVHEDLSLTLSTHNTTRKWENIEHNQEVAVTFGWNFAQPNIQYEGIAQKVMQGKDYTWHEELYFKEHPELSQFKGPETVFIKINPRWIRLSDFSAHPPSITEKKV